MNSSQVALCGDNWLGPGVLSSECRGGFEFTLLFEDSFLAILPAACFLVISPFRAVLLLRRSIRVRPSALYLVKLVAILAYIGVQIAILVLSTSSRVRTHATVAAATLALVSGLLLAPLSHLEHTKTIRPSFLINFFLLISVLFDIVRIRTQWLLGDNGNIAVALSVSLAVTIVLLILEAIEKRFILFGAEHISTESTSGLFSRSSFWWLNSLLLKGSKHVLTSDELPVIHEKLDSEQLGDNLQSVWDNCNQNRKHSLALACLWSLRWEVLAIVVPKLCYVGLSVSQTYLIQTTVSWVQEAESPTSKSRGYGLIGAFAFVYIGLALTMGWSSHLTFRLMTMIRGSLVSVIYAKLTGLQHANIKESAAMTLLGADVPRIAETFYMLLIDTIPSLIQLAIGLYLLYSQLGAVCVAPILITIISTALSTQLARRITPRQKAWLEAIQKRINYTSEILGSMKNVKMLGLSDKMSANIQDMRDKEMDISKKYRRLQSFNVSLVNLPSSLNRFLIFAAYTIYARVNGSDGFSVSQAITALAALVLLSNPLGNLLVSIPTGWAALGCFTRIQDFLLEASYSEPRVISSSAPSASLTPGSRSQEDIELQPLPGKSIDGAVQVEHASFGWSNSSSNLVKNVTTHIERSCPLTIVVGPVGCGKSTFLKGLLGETTCSQGLLQVPVAEVAYCDQTPWVYNGSIRENIVANGEFDEAWYTTVLQSCALHIDLRVLPEGDATIVGSKGVKLSGGQKQRLSIARAVYSRKKLAILDDVLSGLDSTTEDLVFKRVFGRAGLFRKTGTMAILATHSVKHLPQADKILAFNQSGELVEQGKFADINIPGSYIYSLRVKLEKEAHEDEINEDGIESDIRPQTKPTSQAELDESRKTGDWTVYKYYGRVLGPLRLLIFAMFVASHEVFTGLGSVWINWWASSNDSSGESRLGYWLGIFGFISFMDGFTLAMAIAYLWTVIVPNSGKNLHRSMISAAARAPLSFFAKTETGVLTNRFSQDLRLADMALPGAIIASTFQLGACGVVIALAVTAVGYFATVLPVVLIALYFIQRFYLRTSRQLRLLELEAAAPIYSHFIESLHGLVTIRAFGWKDSYQSKNRRLLNTAQKPYYLLFCIQRWLVLVLDLVVAALAVLLVGMAVALRDRLDAGFLGLALVNMMDLSHALTDLVQQWTNLETSLGAIARIKGFKENTPSEAHPENESQLGANWPSHGALRFERVTASYSQESTPVLKDVTLAVSGGQKLGIVGRTGSGKSSSVLAILQLIDIESGKIVLDDIDLATVEGSVVREKLNSLTQDPFFFPGSVRENINPLDQSSDEEIASALNKVGLWNLIQRKANGAASDTSGVLDTVMDADFLSHGQRQLFCLARAMLKPGKVLILDEPTSSVDTQTDAQIQQIIRSEFSHHTIIMIAHRLSSLLDFDQVAVLDAGQLVEFGKPADLLQNNNSHFARMYNGPTVK
ncbi:ABC transporter [Xylariales sp. PMI_506]|nr:ABC transporter [Xylariales sp. PMI_506]